MTNMIDESNSNRFLDADEEPHRALTPIEGYERQPLVSLEEAVQPLSHLLHNLNNMVSTAKWNSRQPEDDLSPDESAAIHLYTMQWPRPHPSLYTLLNQRLRSEERKDLIPWFRYLKLFLTALYKLPSIKDTIWRGIHGDVSDQYQIDQIWWGVSSCTETMEIMQKFVGRSGLRTLFTIEAVNGKSIKAHSHYKRENEIILMPGTYFKVRSKWSPAENLFLIQLKETNPPWQLIAPPFQSNLPVSTPDSENIESVQRMTSTKQFIPLRSTDIAAGAKWAEIAEIVAGNNRQGNGLDQLNRPCGLFIDNNQVIYIADRCNHRIVKWTHGQMYGEVVAGGNGSGNTNNQLCLPTDVIIDAKSDSLIICDAENRRVVRWPCQGASVGETIISDIDCFGLTMDKNGFLYISDDIKHKVRRWVIEETHGTLVAGGNGRGDRLNQFNRPTYLFIDQNQSLYVSDHINRRVMKWAESVNEGIVVAGDQDFENHLSKLSYPRGLIVDQMNNIYVVDLENHRIIRWSNETKQGSIIVGGNGQGIQLDQMNGPNGISFDVKGNLYVVDSDNNRVLKFNVNVNSPH